MPAWVLPAALGAADLVSGVLTNNSAKKEARRNREFVERMSSTAYQRAVTDLKKAGLNPMLAYQQGGASTPGGTQPSLDNPMSGAVHSALGTMQAKASVENIKANTAKQKAETSQILGTTPHTIESAMWESNSARERAHNLQLEAQRIAADIKKVWADTDLTTTQIETGKLNNEQLRKLQPLAERLAKAEAAGAELGLSQKEVDAQFAESLGESSKIIQLLRQIFGR